MATFSDITRSCRAKPRWWWWYGYVTGLLIWLVADSSSAAIVRVNTAAGSNGASGGNLDLTVAAPTAGNTLVAAITLHASSATTGVSTITQSGVMWIRAAFAPNPGNVDTEIWYAPNIPAGAGTNITISSTYNWYAAAVIAEYSGLSSLIPVDTIAANNGTATSADTGTTATTSQANELWFGVIGLANGTTTLGTPKNSFAIVTNAVETTTAKVYALEKIVTASGAADSGGTLSSPVNWNGLIVAFKGGPVLTTNQIATALAPVAGMHPRLFLTMADVASLRAKTNSGTYKNYWTNLYAYAQALAAQTPPAFTTNLDQRGNGDNISNIAFAYLLSGDTNLLAGAVNWATTICNYPAWTGVGFDGTYGLAYGHELLGLAMLYDYAYANLDAATRQLIYNTLIYRGGQQSQAFLDGEIGPIYISNQMWVQSAGVLAAALATFDQPTNSAVLNWISLMEDNFAASAQMLSPDGVHVEGLEYAEYGGSFLLESWQLCSQLLGVNYFSTAQAWGTNTGTYLADMLIPRNSWANFGWNNSQVSIPFEDCHTYNEAPGMQLRGLAHLYQDTLAQWYADRLDAIPGINGMTADFPWQFLYWYDDTVPSVAPTNLPTLQVFNNFQIASSRSDWSGNESLLTFKCGGPWGLYVPAHYADYFNGNNNASPAAGHNHPDEGSFCFFAGGEWLITEPGYYTRSTCYENTLIVDGNGQNGETPSQSFNFSPLTTNVPSLTYASSTAALDTLVGDATSVYASSLGVQSFQRHILFVKPDILIVGDNVRMNSTGHALDLYFHLPNTNSVVAQGDGSLLATTPNTATRIDLLTPAVSTMTNGLQAILARGATNVGRIETLVDIKTTGRTNWQNVMVFSWAANGLTPAKATLMSSNASSWLYQVGTHVVNLNWQAFPSNAPVTLSADESRIYGNPSTITASASGGAGTVQFYVDGAVYGSPVALADGHATIPSTASLGAGSHTVMGVYSGDATHPGGAAASEATLTVTPLPVVLTGSRAYDGTTNAAASILRIVNSLDGTNLTLAGSGTLAGKDVGSQALSPGIPPTLVSIATASGTGTNACTVTLSAKPTDGNTLIAVSLYHTGGTHNPGVNSIRQTGGAWTQATYTNGCGQYVTEIWYATNVLNAGTNITVNWIGSNPAAAAVMEYSSLSPVLPVDGVAGNGSATAGTTADTGAIPLTAQANELWIAAVGLNNNGYRLNPARGGFSILTNVLGQVSGYTFNLTILQKIANTAGPANSGGTISASSAWNGVIAAFKAAQVAPPLSLSGSAAGNYSLAGDIGSVTITNALLSVSGITASNKIFDGTAIATLNNASAALVGNLNGGNVVLNTAGAIGTFIPDGSVGTNKTVLISGLTVSGSATNNYVLVQPATTASIAPLQMTLTSLADPLTLTFTGNPGSSYFTQRSTNLITWTTISTNTPAGNGAVSSIQDFFSDLGGRPPAAAFYRLKAN